MKEIVQQPDENRLKYLARVLTYLMKNTIAGEQVVKYDNTTCDGLCLADDFNIELDALIVEKSDSKKLCVGQNVIVLPGATAWMQHNKYWVYSAFPESIDCLCGFILLDYTNLPGKDSHFVVDLGIGVAALIDPQFLEVINHG